MDKSKITAAINAAPLPGWAKVLLGVMLIGAITLFTDVMENWEVTLLVGGVIIKIVGLLTGGGLVLNGVWAAFKSLPAKDAPAEESAPAAEKPAAIAMPISAAPQEGPSKKQKKAAKKEAKKAAQAVLQAYVEAGGDIDKLLTSTSTLSPAPIAPQEEPSV